MFPSLPPLHLIDRGAWVEHDTNESDVIVEEEEDDTAAATEIPSSSGQPLPVHPECASEVSREEQGLLALQRALMKQVNEARTAANMAKEEAEAAAEAIARSAALAKERRIRALEAEMQAACEAEGRVVQLENEQAELAEKVGNAAHEINRLRETTETEQTRTQELRKEKAAIEHEAEELMKKSKAIVKQIKTDVKAQLIAELRMKESAAKGNSKVHVNELTKRLEELKHEAADLHRSMEAERLAHRDENKRHQAALDDIRSRMHNGSVNVNVGASNPRLKAQLASLADAKQVRDSALMELRAARDNEMQTTKSLEEAEMALGAAKESRSKHKSKLESQLELARINTEDACKAMESSMKRQRERFASALLRYKGDGVPYSELADRIKTECTRLAPQLSAGADGKKNGQLKVGGRATEGNNKQELCVICQSGEKSSKVARFPKDEYSKQQLHPGQAVSVEPTVPSRIRTQGVDDIMSMLSRRIDLWKLEAVTARENSELEELVETEEAIREEASTAASKVEVLTEALLKAQGEMNDAQASLEMLQEHSKSLSEVEDQAERARTLQAQLRREKDELLRWKVAADAAEKDLESRREMMEKNETQLKLLDQELQNVSAEKSSTEAALRSVNAQLAQLQRGGVLSKTQGVEAYSNPGQLAEIQDEVDRTKLEIETVNKGLKRAKKLAAAIKTQLSDDNVNNRGILAEIAEQEMQGEQFTAQANDFWRRKRAQDDARREADADVADASSRLVETHLELQVLSENLVVMRDEHAELLRARDRRANQKLTISDAGSFACSGK